MRASLEVDLSALVKNANTLFHTDHLKDGFFCPIIKANAYGCGAVRTAAALGAAGFKRAGVISVDEALQLKDTAAKHRITLYIFGPFNKAEAKLIYEHSFVPVVGQWECLKLLAQLGQKLQQKGLQKKSLQNLKQKPLRFHLKFNTGMNRFGFYLSEASLLLEFIKQNTFLELEGLASHLSQGPQAGRQSAGAGFKPIQDFKKIILFFQKNWPHQPLHTHLFNSTGRLSFWSYGQTDPALGFRPGISLYGIKPPLDLNCPEAKKQYKHLLLKSAVCLKSFTVHSLVVSAGEGVSYSREWTAPRKTTLAVVSMGYADGLPYRLSQGGGEVLFRGKRAPIVGRICMDFFMIDVTDIIGSAEVKPGEEVVIFGRQKNQFISLEEQAEKSGSLYYELLACLGLRVKRIYK